MFRVDFKATCGRQVMVYGQTEVTRDLYDAQDAIGATVISEAEDVALHDLTGSALCDLPGERRQRIGWTATIVAGCDGFHGVSRQSMPAEVRREYEKVYPFGWLGILSRTPPVAA